MPTTAWGPPPTPQRQRDPLPTPMDVARGAQRLGTWTIVVIVLLGLLLFIGPKAWRPDSMDADPNVRPTTTIRVSPLSDLEDYTRTPVTTTIPD